MRLLQRTIRLYSVLSICVILIGIPFFYILLQSVVKEEVDEELIVNKALVVQRLEHMGKNPDLRAFNDIDHDMIVTADSGTGVSTADNFSTVSRYDSVIKETLLIRVLTTGVTTKAGSYRVTLMAPMVDHNDLIRIVLLVQVALLVLLFIGLWAINKNVSSAYLLQKEFTENAAHEMQTPLAVLQSKLELLMQTTPLTPVQASLIGKMADASQGMNKLNKALVMLTRIENHQFDDKEKVNPGEVLTAMLDRYEDIIAEKNIAIFVRQDAVVKLDANKTLIEILIGNLLSNAIRHNHNGGVINLSFVERELMIENSGVEKALNTVKLSQRFARESTDRSSLGLGLQIVDKICVLNNYSLKYKFTGHGHRFTIRF